MNDDNDRMLVIYLRVVWGILNEILVGGFFFLINVKYIFCNVRRLIFIKLLLNCNGKKFFEV